MPWNPRDHHSTIVLRGLRGSIYYDGIYFFPHYAERYQPLGQPMQVFRVGRLQNFFQIARFFFFSSFIFFYRSFFIESMSVKFIWWKFVILSTALENHVCIYIYIYAYVYSIYICIYIYMYIRMNKDMYLYTHIFIEINPYIYVCFILYKRHMNW